MVKKRITLPFQLLLPTMASLPLLMVYYVTCDRTDIVVPVILRPFLGTNVDLSLLVCKHFQTCTHLVIIRIISYNTGLPISSRIGLG